MTNKYILISAADAFNASLHGETRSDIIDRIDDAISKGDFHVDAGRYLSEDTITWVEDAGYEVSILDGVYTITWFDA